MLMTYFHDAVSKKRGSGTKTEMAYVASLCSKLPISMIDEAGNLYVDLRTEPHHRTCFTAHTDTVHHNEGENGYTVDGDVWRANGDALGADDGAGIALLMHLIDHKVPALYAFFRGEECGANGSSTAAQTDMFDGIDRAIAFDRAGYHDVITHQAGGRCCSNVFADALSTALSNEEFSLAYVPCDKGVFTDTANLIDLIPECTNVSVGYFDQHSDREKQDVAFLQLLADKIVTIDWDALPTERSTYQPKDKFSERGWRYKTSPFITTLEDALDGDEKGLRELLIESIGEEYRYYIDRLTIDYPALTDAYDDSLAGVDDETVLSSILSECSVI